MVRGPTRFLTGILNALGALPVMGYASEEGPGGQEGGTSDKVFGGDRGLHLRRPGFILNKRTAGGVPDTPVGHGYSRCEEGELPAYLGRREPGYRSVLRQPNREFFDPSSGQYGRLNKPLAARR